MSAHAASPRPARIRARLAVLFLLPVLALAAAGCGGDKDAAPARQPAAGSLLPATADSLAADSTAVAVPADAGLGAGEFAPAGRPDMPDATAALKSASAPVRDAAGPSGAARVRGTTAPAAASGGAFSLQLGSFARESNARGLVDRIAGLGYAPVMEVATLGGQTYHRVVLPGLADRAAAERLGERLRAELGITYLIRRD